MNRRIITIDVGNMTPLEAENYIRAVQGLPPIKRSWWKNFFETIGMFF
jgi:hypothetical protein